MSPESGNFASPSDLQRLRQAFAAEGPELLPCPPAEKIFAAAHGELEEGKLGELLDHLASCAACSEAWRLALEIRKEVAPEPARTGVVVPGNFGRPGAGGAGRRMLPWTGLVAALLLAALALPYLLPTRTPDEPPATRGAAEVQVVDASGPLDRDRCVLRWRLEPAREGARYEVLVTSETLEPVASRAALAAAELEIPEARLAGIPPGGYLLWQVQASLPDGSRIDSATFRSPLPDRKRPAQ